jgi:thiamine-phosphate pyrophosphorylase
VRPGFRLVLLTPPGPHPQERAVIECWLEGTLDARLHLRRPTWTLPETAAWLRQLPASWLPRIVVHAFPELVAEFGLGGCHLTATARAAGPRPVLPPGATLSTALHTLEEVRVEAAGYDYVLLSPIFNSISKSGYEAAFSPETVAPELRRLPQARVLALGGVTAAHLLQLQAAGFAGAAVLGSVWQAAQPVAAAEQLRTTAEMLSSGTA